MGGGSCAATFAYALADVEGDAAGSSAHLATEVGLAAREAGDDTADSTVRFQRASVDVELVEVVAALSRHLGLFVFVVPWGVTVTVLLPQGGLQQLPTGGEHAHLVIGPHVAV